VVCCALVLLSGCVGPTTNETALRKQASMSAQSAVSELETVELVTRTRIRGNAWWAYTDLTVTSSEKAIGTIADTFGSRQAPSPSLDSLYERVSGALSDAADLVTQVRVAVRRHDVAQLRKLDKRLAEMSSRLQKLEQVG
jgi:hypothetical protein